MSRFDASLTDGTARAVAPCPGAIALRDVRQGSDGEEGVGKGDLTDVARVVVGPEARVDEVDHWELHRLVWRDGLVLEAEALELGEIGPGALRRDVVGGASRQRLVRGVGDLEEGELAVAE